MSERGFFSRILGGDSSEDDTRIYSAEEIGVGRPRGSNRQSARESQLPGFTVERASEIIDDLPPDVPRESAVRIVRGTLKAAGIDVEDLERSTRARESKLSSEMKLARERQEELRKKTEEVVRSLEEEIRKARDACETGITEEEELISRASVAIENIKRVRVFFDFTEPEEQEIAGPAEHSPGDEVQVIESPDPDKTQVLRRPDSLSSPDRSGDATSDNPSSRNPFDTASER